MFDIHGVLKDLSKHRPIFCSEADFPRRSRMADSRGDAGL